MKAPLSPHSFHIPVMGTGFTIDSPIKVAHMGISSVISIIDHRLTEQMREYYSGRYGFPFELIKESEDDCRARRITAYLNLVQKIVDKNISRVRKSSIEPGSELSDYCELLNYNHPIKTAYHYVQQLDGKARVTEESNLRKLILPGTIDVNIMTKIDGPITSDQDSRLNDAHAALRGFANSDLESSVVFSAGLNPRLYSYMSEFDDFFPDKNGHIKKKVTLKVSDYRSALIQGKFLAKKGIWVSEFRIESGLNCGGHAFATDGYLLGPILKEFNENREELSATLFELYAQSLKDMDKQELLSAPEMLLSVQGGVGTSTEHQFLIDHYDVDSVGWGSPFLLVPEAVSIDNETLNILSEAKEDDYYLSDASPLGVRFNMVRGSTAETEKMDRIANGKPGAPCVKKHLAFNTDFTDNAICTASVKYQRNKIEELDKLELSEAEYSQQIRKITEKMCLCMGLGNSSLIEKGIELSKTSQGSAICPGPNTAYFSRKATLQEMIHHIYGRINLINNMDRPDMFIKELGLYMDYYREELDKLTPESSKKEMNYLNKFRENLIDGINYYQELSTELGEQFPGYNAKQFALFEQAKAALGLEIEAV